MDAIVLLIELVITVLIFMDIFMRLIAEGPYFLSKLSNMFDIAILFFLSILILLL